MVRSHSSRGALLSSNLPQLQNLIKRDPSGYKEEFLQQKNRYQSILEIFHTNPDDESDDFREIVTFLAQVTPCYLEDMKGFPRQISTLLLEKYAELDVETRKCLISNLIIMRKKDVLDPIELLKTLFPLLSLTTSSTLRSFVRSSILSEIRTSNMKKNDHKLNRAVQSMLFRIVEQNSDMDVIPMKGKHGSGGDASSSSSQDALWSIFLVKDLWKKGLWNDAKTVSIASLGCFHPVTKVQSAALHFFLGSEEEDSDSEEEDTIPNVKALEHRRGINKKTRSGDKKLAKTVKIVKKKKQKAKEGPLANFAALQLLHDPQTFAEKLFDLLNRYDKRFSLDHKILIMQVLCRTMGLHKLCVLNFYTYVVKYLTHHQLRTTTILVCLAQSVHELTPPDVLTPVIRKLAQEFVHPGVASEVLVVGLNSIREICKRQPWCMEEDLLADLVEYRKSKEKPIVMAARSMLQLYRQTIPTMLKRRERGKEASMNMGTEHHVPFGHQQAGPSGIEGLNLLEEHLRKAHEDGDDIDDEEAGWDDWEEDSESSDSSSEEEGWIDVSSDEDEDIVLTDDEEDKRDVTVQDPLVEGTSDVLPGGGDQGGLPSIASTKILTPADFALLADLRLQAAEVEAGPSTSSKKRKLAAMQVAKDAATLSNQPMTEGDLIGPRKKAKATYEERMTSIRSGREGREKFGSSKGKKNKEAPSSSTNREKARNKPIMMIMASGAVRGKKKASLREKQRKLKAHTEKQKKRKH